VGCEQPCPHREGSGLGRCIQVRALGCFPGRSNRQRGGTKAHQEQVRRDSQLRVLELEADLR